MELTDHSSCVEFHADAQVECNRDSYPFGDWSPMGIYASDSSAVKLQNLNIHGFAATGIQAGRLSDWTLQDVRIARNGWVGWDGDLPGESDTNHRTLSFKGCTVECNGCGETYPGGDIHSCWGQSAGGYGDGLGTGSTGGHWIIEDSVFRYNTSDGLDLLYVREPGSQIEIKRSRSYSNAGDQFKTNGPVSFENCLAVSECAYFSGKSFTYDVDHCRSGGSAVIMVLQEDSRASLVHSTLAGQGDCLLLVECEGNSCEGAETTVVNTIFRGYEEFHDPYDLSCYIWFHPDLFGTSLIDYNIIYNAKIGNTPLGNNDLNQDPALIDDDLASFDYHLQPNSPAVDSGLALGSLGGLLPDHDLQEASRPFGSGSDRGCFEYVTKADIIFNWLESLFPEILKPSPQATLQISGILYRYYPATNVYIATFQNHLFFIDHLGNVHDLGEVDFWLPMAQGG